MFSSSSFSNFWVVALTTTRLWNFSYSHESSTFNNNAISTDLITYADTSMMETVSRVQHSVWWSISSCHLCIIMCCVTDGWGSDVLVLWFFSNMFRMLLEIWSSSRRVSDSSSTNGRGWSGMLNTTIIKIRFWSSVVSNAIASPSGKHTIAITSRRMHRFN